MRKAHTLIESIMVVVLVGIISFVFAIYIQEGFNAWQFISGQKSIAMSSRSALNRMVREIKRCEADSINAAQPAVFVFNDSITDMQVSFLQVGSDLSRGGSILLSDLQNPGGLLFTYLDENGAELPQPIPDNNLVRVVKCRLIVVKNDNKFVIESAARIRNRIL
ncbi:MAG: hypothetical protein ABIH69_00335 [bacterium]